MKLSVLIFTLMFCSYLSGQGTKLVELKNGNKYVGTVVRNDSNKLVLMGRDYNTYVFDTADVLKISENVRRRLPSVQSRSGVFNEASIQLVSMYYKGFYVEGTVLNYSLGKYFNYKHSVSADVKIYIHFGFLPTIGATYKYQLFKNPSSPFVYASIGNYYEPGWSQSVGSRYGGGLGYQFGLRGSKRFVLKADYTRATTKYYNLEGDIEPFTDVMLNFGFGWFF